MDITVLEQAGVNYQEGLKRFAGVKAIYEKYLKKFLTDTEYQTLMEKLDEKDYQEAFKCAHSMKGIAGNLSMDGLYQSIVPLVEALRNTKLDNLEQLRADVEKEYALICEALKKAE